MTSWDYKDSPHGNPEEQRAAAVSPRSPRHPLSKCRGFKSRLGESRVAQDASALASLVEHRAVTNHRWVGSRAPAHVLLQVTS